MFNFDAGFLAFYKFFDLNFSGKEGTIEEENYAKGSGTRFEIGMRRWVFIGYFFTRLAHRRCNRFLVVVIVELAKIEVYLCVTSISTISATRGRTKKAL